jgi:hypothetical protein
MRFTPTLALPPLIFYRFDEASLFVELRDYAVELVEGK